MTAASTDRSVATATDDPPRDHGMFRALRVRNFRHTAASLAIASGAAVKVVQQMLGHSSATMTLDELASAIRKVKAATDRPFGVNIRADASDADDRVQNGWHLGGLDWTGAATAFRPISNSPSAVA